MPRWIGRWAGGRKYLNSKGEVRFWLDRSFNRRRYGVRLNVSSEKEANAELALWERDPVGYMEREAAKRKADEDRVVMTEDLVGEYRRHLEGLGRERRHIQNCCSYLLWWVEQLKGRDLRTVTLKDLQKALRTARTARRNRIASYKVFCTFLREEMAVLPRGQDASLDIHAPPPRPEKDVRDKGHSLGHVSTVYNNLSPWPSEGEQHVQPIRDYLCVLAKTGMHQTEVQRMARGECEVINLDDHGEIAGVVRFIHKRGTRHAQSLDRQTLEAARRLISDGGAPGYGWVRKCVRKACERAGVPELRLGELRHSFVTWAREGGREVKPKEGGLSLEAIAAAVGHTSTKTTSRFYDCTKVPPLVVVPLELEHPDDPPYGPHLRLVGQAQG